MDIAGIDYSEQEEIKINMSGKVYIIGAGPGAADLLTVRAANILRSAQVVLHDDLVSREVLDLVPSAANTINVGKRCGNHSTSQEQIHALMISHAQKGSTVVRLKSGDPAIFGRLGEEIDALRESQIAFEVVPGITAAHAGAAAASFTLTDRRSASALVLLTAHHCANGSRALFDPAKTTYAVYMPGPDYGKTAHQLLAMGLDEDTPCALISQVSSSQQQVRFLELSQLHAVTGVPAPALLIVGEVTRRKELAELDLPSLMTASQDFSPQTSLRNLVNG